MVLHLPEAVSTVTVRQVMTFENFDVQTDGLSSDCIYEVCESSIQKGDLLLITNQGFSQFNYPSKKFYNYGTENGFPVDCRQ